MKIQDLKEPHKSIAIFDCKKQGNEKNIDNPIAHGNVINWDKTKAGFRFYSNLDRKNYPEITPQIKLDYPEVFRSEFINKEKALEMEKQKEFKVGDEIRLEHWGKEELLTIDFIGKTHYFGTDEKGVELSFRKKEDWIPYIKPIEKIKLQKFYCYNQNDDNNYIVDEGIKEVFYGSIEDAKYHWDVALTEEEFLEQFEIK